MPTSPPSVPPEVSAVDSDLVVVSPGDITLAFSINGSNVLPANITWVFDETTITDASDSRYSFSEDSLSLTIFGVLPKDEGVYVLTATNPGGSDSAFITLTVQGECTTYTSHSCIAFN